MPVRYYTDTFHIWILERIASCAIPSHFPCDALERILLRCEKLHTVFFSVRNTCVVWRSSAFTSARLMFCNREKEQTNTKRRINEMHWLLLKTSLTDVLYLMNRSFFGGHEASSHVDLD